MLQNKLLVLVTQVSIRRIMKCPPLQFQNVPVCPSFGNRVHILRCGLNWKGLVKGTL